MGTTWTSSTARPKQSGIYGQTVTFSATVSGAAVVPAGQDTITAAYTGGANYASGSNSVAITLTA